MFENNKISFLLAGKSKLLLNEKSYIYKTLYYVSPSYACFKDITADYHVEVVDKATGKVDVRFSLLKDTYEMFQLVGKMKPSMIECEVLIGQLSHLKLDYVVTGNEKTITTSLNYIDTKLVAKMKPSMIEFEVLIGQVSHLKLDYVVTRDEQIITTSLNYIDMKLVAKMKPSMIESELLIGQVSHLKYIHEFKFENNEISFLVAGKPKLHLHEKSYLYKTLYYLSPSYACFKDMTTNYHVEVVDKATGKVDVQFSVLKDTLEMFHLAINNVLSPYKLILKAPYLVTSIEYEHLLMKVSINIINIRKIYLLQLTPIGNNEYEFTVNGETLVHLALNEKQIEFKPQYNYCPDFTAIITWKTFSIFENSIGIQLLHKQITHTTLLGWNMSKLAKAFVEVKVTGSGTSLLGEYEMLHHLKVTPMGKNKYEVKVNGETLVHLVPGKNQIEIITQHEDIPTLTTIITWKTLSIFENTIGVQLLYNKVTHKTLLAWNINKLVKAFVEIKVTGSGTTLLGEYELFHHLNWNIIDIKNMDLVWNSKALITGL